MTESVPWIKWRFDKWASDAGLRMCSLAARGLWVELLGIMHNAAPYGHLSVKGKTPTPKQIASLVGMTSEKEVVSLMRELEDAEVFSRTGDGLIFSRRMVRDNDARMTGKRFGSMGGNPNIVKDKTKEVNTEQLKGVNPPPKPREEIREKEGEEKESSSLRSDGASAPRSKKPPSDPTDPKVILWNEGRTILGRLTGQPRTETGKLIGNLVATAKAPDDTTDHSMIMEVIHDAERCKPDQPFAWIKAAIKSRMAPTLFGDGKPDPYGIRAWAARQPDVRDELFGGVPMPAIKGQAIEANAESIAVAVGLPETWRGNWDTMGAWMRDDILLDEHVFRAIGAVSRRLTSGIGGMQVFDTTVRSVGQRSAA